MKLLLGALGSALLGTACGGGPEFEGRAGTTTLAASAAEQPRELDAVLVAKQASPAFRFSIRDGADGRPTTLSALAVHVRSTLDARKLSWGLESSLGRLRGSVSGEVGDQRIDFAAAGIRVVDGAELACTLTLEGDPGATVAEGAMFALEVLGRDQVLDAGSTALSPDARAENGVGFRYVVVASELRIVEQPPASLNVGEPFSLVAAFTDALGHVDRDVNGDAIAVYRTDTLASVGMAVALDGVARFREENALYLEDPPNLALNLQLVDAPSGMLDLSAKPASTTPLSLSGGNDADARLEPSALLDEPLELDLSQALGGEVDVLDFDLVDGGGGDGLSCSVGSLAFVVAGIGLDQADRFRLRGPGLDAGTEGSLLLQGEMGVVAFEDLPIEVPEGASATYTLSLELAPDHVHPGDTLLIALDSANVRSWGTTVSSGDVSNAPGLSVISGGLTLGLNGAEATPLAGGQAALVVQESCDDEQVVIGYRMTSHYAGSAFVSSVQTLCGRLQLASLETPEVWVWPDVELAQRGLDGSQAFELACPVDQVVVGLHGGAGAALDRLGIDCAQLLLTGEQALSLGPITSLSAEGGSGGLAFTVGCPGSTVARGSATRVRDEQTDFGFVSLEALGLVCGQVELR